MPRKKLAKKTKKSARQQRKKVAARSKKLQVKWTESYSSFLLGVVAVIVVVLFGVSIIRQHHPSQQTSSLSIGPTTSVTPSPTPIQSGPTPGTTVVQNGNTYYIVKTNDSLWTIAVAVYNNGYKWVDIAKANNIANPSYIFTGDKLYIPNAPAPSELGQMVPKPTAPALPNAITGTSYTVQKGDDLWGIAIRAYADGYQWTKIAKANNLANPDLIFSGNVLTIPR